MASESPVRTYEAQLDLARNESRILGASDFYGRPLLDGKVPPSAFLEAIYAEDLDEMLAVIQKLPELKMGQTMRYTLRFVHVDGRVIRSVYESTPIELNSDGRVRVVRSKVRWFIDPS